MKWALLQFEGKALFDISETQSGSPCATFTGEFQANREAQAQVATELSVEELNQVCWGSNVPGFWNSW